MKPIVIGMTHDNEDNFKEVMKKFEELIQHKDKVGYEIPLLGHNQKGSGSSFAELFYVQVADEYEVIPLDSQILYQKQMLSNMMTFTRLGVENFMRISLERSAFMAQQIWKNQVPLSIIGNMHLYDMRELFKLDFVYIPTNLDAFDSWSNMQEFIERNDIKNVIKNYLEDIPHIRTPTFGQKFTGLVQKISDGFNL